MNKYVVWFFFACLLSGQTNSHIVHKKQKELTKVSVDAQKKIAVGNSLKLNVERKAIYDAHLDAKKWLFYPILSGLSFGSLVIGNMLVKPHEFWESATVITLFTSTSLVSSYYILKTNNNKFAITSYNIRSELLQLYKSTYTKEFRKKAFKNIIIGSVAMGIISGLGTLIFVDTVKSGLGDGPGLILTPPDA
tara:strand:- start:502 stop:1077 length:576 start_codon:yes stop_codon:yes gene_type:complete